MAVSTAQDDRKKALNLAIAQIEKSCGKGSIMKMGADSPKVRIEAIPTGAINLDLFKPMDFHLHMIAHSAGEMLLRVCV